MALKIINDFEDKKVSVTNIYRIDEKNIGDIYSSPLKYFDLGESEEDIWQLNHNYNPAGNNVIFGGGGLIGQMRPLVPLTYVLQKKGYKLFGWGIGDHSFVCMDEQTQYIPELNVTYPSYILEWDLLGLRDWYPPLFEQYEQMSWVPCVSCMSEVFDKEYNIEHDFVMYAHQHMRFEQVVGMHLVSEEQRLTNQSTSLEDTIEFLASGETVITNSFHGAYWATLLKRKVICFPYSSKFWGLKHKPVYSYPQAWKESFDKTKVYDDALEECREANKSFYNKLLERISE